MIRCFKIKTTNGSTYMVDLKNRTLSRNGETIDLLEGSVNIVSLSQREEVNKNGSYDGIFDYKKFPPHISDPYKLVFQKSDYRIDCSSLITKIEKANL